MVNFCLIPRILFKNMGTISYNKFVFASQRSQKQGNRFSIFLYQSSALDYISSSFFIVQKEQSRGKRKGNPFSKSIKEKDILSVQGLFLVLRLFLFYSHPFCCILLFLFLWQIFQTEKTPIRSVIQFQEKHARIGNQFLLSTLKLFIGLFYYSSYYSFFCPFPTY